MANCQNCVDVPAVWPSSVPHLCSKCHSNLDIMRQGLERNNYAVVLSKAGDKKKVKQLPVFAADFSEGVR